MKRTNLLLIALVTATSVFAQSAKKETKVPTEDDMGAYVMVYHKDQDHSLHMAVSYDSYN